MMLSVHSPDQIYLNADTRPANLENWVFDMSPDDAICHLRLTSAISRIRAWETITIL
jgi:hypothetical protein